MPWSSRLSLVQSDSEISCTRPQFSLFCRQEDGHGSEPIGVPGGLLGTSSCHLSSGFGFLFNSFRLSIRNGHFFKLLPILRNTRNQKGFFFFLILFLLFHLKMSQGWGEGCTSVKVFVIQRGGTGWSSDPRSHIKCLGAINNVQLQPQKVETGSPGNRLDRKSRHVCQLRVCLRDPDPKSNTEALAIPVEL